MTENDSNEQAPVEGKDFTTTRVYRLKGRVVHGFGRGSKLLGFPTANLDPKAFLDMFKGVEHGVYLGFAKITKPADIADDKVISTSVHKAMLSLGTNPQFDTKEDTLEAYIDYNFDGDFYDYEMSLIICAYRRPQLKFDSLDSLIHAIKTDVEVGNTVLDLPSFKALRDDEHFAK